MLLFVLRYWFVNNFMTDWFKPGLFVFNVLLQ